MQVDSRGSHPRVHLFRVVGSTNNVARRLSDEGAKTGTLVIAEEQRAGRGRGDRTWASPAGLGLWCSLILRGIAHDTLGPLPLQFALATAQALDRWIPDGVRLKWPNDLRSGGRKLGGILCEASWDGAKLGYVIVGIGINLLQNPEDFPAALRPHATSVRLASDHAVPRFDVVTDILKELRELLRRLSAGESELQPQDFASRDELVGKWIEVREPESSRILLTGVARGVTRDGALLVSSGERLVPVTSGTVRILTE